jgi:hypothetical protein
MRSGRTDKGQRKSARRCIRSRKRDERVKQKCSFVPVLQLADNIEGVLFLDAGFAPHADQWRDLRCSGPPTTREKLLVAGVAVAALMAYTLTSIETVRRGAADNAEVANWRHIPHEGDCGDLRRDGQTMSIIVPPSCHLKP